MNEVLNKPKILEQLGNTHCVIEASAGTGKTYLIEQLVIDLVIKGVSLSKILVVTFTNKATVELKTRIRARLKKILATSTKENKTVEPYCITNNTTWNVDETTCALLKEAISHFNKINISTIHGFCQQIIEESAFESCQLFKKLVVHDNHVFNYIFKKNVRTILAQVGSEQRFLAKALTSMGGIDGLGHLLQAAIKEQANLELPDIRILSEILVNFPIAAVKKCIKEIQNYQERSATAKYLYGPILTSLKTSKVTSISYKSINSKLKKILLGIDEYNKNGMPGMFWSEVTPADLSYLKDKFTNNTEVNITAIANACKKLLSNAYDFKAVIVATLLPQLSEEIISFKYKKGLIDFDDMILTVNSVINSHHGEPIVRRLQERFQVALIDEFQDTDSLQWEIFKKIFLNSNNHRLILVGDPKQAIYSFRGGDLSTYISAKNTILGITNQKTILLNTNFRSSPELVAAQDKIFHACKESPFFTGMNNGLYKHINCGKLNFDLRDSEGKTIPPLHIIEINKKDALTTRRSIAKGIALTIKKMLNTCRLEEKPIKPEHIMVLTINAKEGLEMAHALKEFGIAHIFFRQDGLFATSDAKALLDLFLAIDEPTDVEKRAKALLGPFFGYSFEEVSQCIDLKEHHPILICLLKWQAQLLSGNYGDFFSSVVSDSNITQRLPRLDEDNRSITNILHLLELLQKETIASYHTPFDIAIKLKQWINGYKQPSAEDVGIQRVQKLTGAVQILTIHKSKGLEAPVVAIYGGFSESCKRTNIHRYHDEQGQRNIWIGSKKFAPIEVQKLIDDERQEEYQRLLYVALTRAKIQLILPKIIYVQNKQYDYEKDKNNLNDRGAYQCVNQQLAKLSRDLDEFSTTTNCDKCETEDQVTNNKIEQKECYSIPKTIVPNFSVLTKIGNPLWEFSSTPINNNLTMPSQRYINNYLMISNIKNIHPDSNYNVFNNRYRLGMAVRQMLRLIPINGLTEQPLSEWIKNPIVANLFEANVPLKLHKITAIRTHRILNCKLYAPENKVIVLSKIKKALRNLDFTTFFPDKNNLINGSLDMMFQWHDKTYILDWKINQLHSYCHKEIRLTIEKKYLSQIRIYIISICRLLNITSEKTFKERFGGLIYAFIGGLPNEGVWTLCPSWKEVEGWELEMEEYTSLKNDITPSYANRST